MSEESRPGQSTHDWTVKLALWTILMLLLAPVLYQCRLRTDINVWRLAQKYEAAVQHPENTKRLLFEARIMSWGSAPSCDPEVVEIRSYKRGEEELIEEFYKGKMLAISDRYSRPVGASFPNETYKRTFSWDEDLMG